MKKIARFAQEHPIRLSLLILIALGLMGFAGMFVGSLPVGNLQSSGQLVAQAVTLSDSDELKAAPDGIYLVYGYLRGDEVLYDDNGRAVIYLTERHKGKNGNLHDEVIFSAKQFYLNDVPIPMPISAKTQYPDFSKQYGSNTYKGLLHCDLGTFVVRKVKGEYATVRFFSEEMPQNLSASFEGTKADWAKPAVFGLLMLLCIVGIGLCLRVPVSHAATECTKPQAQSAEAVSDKPKTKRSRRSILIETVISVAALVFLIGAFTADARREATIAHSGVAPAFAYQPIVPQDVYSGYPYSRQEEANALPYYHQGENHVSLTLQSGSYIVGVHIPEGAYRAQTANALDAVVVTDHAHGIYLYEYAAKEPNYLEDMLLLDGALVQIQSSEPVTLVSDCIRNTDLRVMPNPLSDTAVLDGSATQTAGADFAAGTYDVLFEGDCTEVTVHIFTKSSQEPLVYTFASEEGTEEVWKNLVLPSGATLAHNGTVRLVPSDTVLSTYEEAYYELYW